MSGWDRFKNFIKNPGKWLWAFYVGLLLAICAVVAAAIFLGFENPVVYALSAVFAILAVYCVYASVRPVRAAFARAVYSNRLLSHMARDYGYRTAVFSVVSFAINAVYTIYQTVLAIVFHSAWFALFAGYYFVLSILRVAVILLGRRKAARQAEGDYKVYLACGGMFIVLAVVLATFVTSLTYMNANAQRSVVSAINMAAYAFYKIIAAAIGAAKCRKYGNYSLQSLRNISFADAIVSLFALQVTMVATFGSGEGQTIHVLNIVTGAAVVFITLGMGIYMIVRSARGLITLKKSGATASAPVEDSDER